MGRNFYVSKTYSVFQILWRNCHLGRQRCVKQGVNFTLSSSRHFSDSHQTDHITSEIIDTTSTLQEDKNSETGDESTHNELLAGEKKRAPFIQPMHNAGSVQRITIPIKDPSLDGKRNPRRPKTESDQAPVNHSKSLGSIQLRLQNLSTDQTFTNQQSFATDQGFSTEQRLPGLGKRERTSQNLGRIDKYPLPRVVGEMLFGLHPVSLAIKHGKRNVHTLYVKKELRGNSSENKGDNFKQREEIIELANSINIPVKTLTRSQLDRCSDNRPHQGVCLDVSPIKPSVYDSEMVKDIRISHAQNSNRLPLWLLLYQVQDPMNFGAILRSAYMFGVNRVLSTKINSCSLTPVVSKASAGAMEIMDLYSVSEDLKQFIKIHQESGWSVLGTASANNNNNTGSLVDCDSEVVNIELESSGIKPIPIQDYSMENPAILIIGNEGSGLPQSVLTCCDALVCAEVAPDTSLRHSVDSLNVSVATGTLLENLDEYRGPFHKAILAYVERNYHDNTMPPVLVAMESYFIP